MTTSYDSSTDYRCHMEIKSHMRSYFNLKCRMKINPFAGEVSVCGTFFIQHKHSVLCSASMLTIG